MEQRRSPRTHRYPVGGPTTTRPEDGRRVNLALVLQSLLDEPHLSRADLARRTGLTRVTISDLVAQLMAEELVVETGPASSQRPGKPATGLSVNAAGRAIVALDLSAPNTATGAIYGLDGTVRLLAERDLDSATGEDAYRIVAELARDLIDAAEQPVLGVGVGTPGIVDKAGSVIAAPNLGWHGLALQGRLTAELGAPVHVENDANAAGDLHADQVVGAGLLIAGSVVQGASAAAGEIGDVVFDADGVLAEAGERLGMALSPVVGMLDVTDIVLGGPSAYVEGPLLAAAQRVLTDRTHADFRGGVRLRLSELGADAVLLGSVALVLRTQLGVS